MRKPLPIIHEDTDSLKQRVQHEHNGRKQPRLQMLYWLACGQAQTRLGVAQLRESTAWPVCLPAFWTG